MKMVLEFWIAWTRLGSASMGMHPTGWSSSCLSSARPHNRSPSLSRSTVYVIGSDDLALRLGALPCDVRQKEVTLLLVLPAVQRTCWECTSFSVV